MGIHLAFYGYNLALVAVTGFLKPSGEIISVGFDELFACGHDVSLLSLLL